jgi:trk system potassium uptake protein TrkH
VKSIVKVVSNLGFLLQITGLFLILPIAIGLQATPPETGAVASITATCFLSFGAGFVLNSLCERKELDEKTSLWIMIIVFTILPLVLMIPYVWNNVFASGNPIDLFTNAYFETVSGFTTTGFTLIANAETLPMSLLFYRSLVEFIGGVGFVYLLAAFLYPSRSLDAFAEAFGVDKLSKNLKKVFLSIMLIYTFFVVIFTVIFYFLYQPNGSPDIIIASTAAIDVLTGGYQPNITAGIGIFQISIIVLMLLGSLNFSFHYNLFRMKLRSVLTPEIKLYLEIIAGATLLMAILAWINPFDSLFHVVSMLSSTGIDYINMASTSVAAKIMFILIGLVGGCAFSMAGGIRIQRIRVLIDALRKKSPDREELKAVLIFIVSFFIVLFILSLLFSTIGISLLDSVFEVGSALTTNGISMGITTVAMPLGYKWLLILAMILGRIEIVAVLKILEGTKIFDTVKRLVERLPKRKRRKTSFTVDS